MSSATDGRAYSSRIDAWILKANHDMKPHQKSELGQVFTPMPVARMMAAMLQCRHQTVNLLDAGAGIGALTAACIEHFCIRPPAERPESIQVVSYEIDDALIHQLHQTMELCRLQCSAAGIQFSAEIVHRDFLECAAEQVSDGLFSGSSATQFNCAILNPPYRKIHTQSQHRSLLRRMGLETSNLYTGFLAAAIRLLEPAGEIVAITPRSFCNGPYFTPFRQELLQAVTLKRLHLFESRQETFRDDKVLQETLILHAVKAAARPQTVHVTSGVGVEATQFSAREVPYEEMVSPNDPQAVIHIVSEIAGQETAKRIVNLPCSLSDLGLSVSTGRVVDFRARAFLRSQPEPDTVPLVYPAHLEHGRVVWPKVRGSKPSSLVMAEATQALLVPNEHYVLVRRFSTKEEKKRIVATVFEAGCVPGHAVGFENHLNYFHCRGRGLNLCLARGLAAFLNSTLADTYFRQFNGHTQVNATDLRMFRYPTQNHLAALGAKLSDKLFEQKTLDMLIEKELLVDTSEHELR